MKSCFLTKPSKTISTTQIKLLEIGHEHAVVNLEPEIFFKRGLQNIQATPKWFLIVWQCRPKLISIRKTLIT